MLDSDIMVTKKWVLMFDNARTHLANKTKSFLKNSRITAVLNAPYAPEVNYAEKIIRLLKRKIRLLLDQFR